MKAPGDGTKRCCIPEVIYLVSGSEENAMRMWITRIFRNIGAQYTAYTLL